MTGAELLTLSALAAAAGFSPGPNNALVADSGMRFGFWRTFPTIAGVFIGFPFMVFCIGMGMGSLFSQSPVFREVLRWLGIAVLLYFAWKIATAKLGGDPDEETHPLGFVKMAAFQWVNPKGWAMAISITSQFVRPEALVQSALTVSGVFVLVGLSSASVWTLFGQSMRRFLTSPLRFRIFNISMASLMVLAVVTLASTSFA